MHHHRVLVGLVLIVVLGAACAALMLIATRSDSSLTVGVILSDPASVYGWDATAEDYAEVPINGGTAILFDNLAARSDVTLDQVVASLIERGAQAVFISPLEGDTAGLAQRYPDRVFVLNLSNHDEIARLLPVLPVSQPASQPISSVTEPETETTSKVSSSARAFLLVMIVILVGLGLVFNAWWQRLQSGNRPSSKAKKRSMGNSTHLRALRLEDAVSQRATDFGQEKPLLRELSTYVNGDPHFDESFSIELPDGTFLGECGVSIVAPVDRHHPGQAAAMEVWMFDKTDRQTVEVQLVSEYALKNRDLQDRLTGTPVLLEPDRTAALSTQTLTLRARILEMQYGYSSALPPRSFIEQIVVEVAVWPAG